MAAANGLRPGYSWTRRPRRPLRAEPPRPGRSAATPSPWEEDDEVRLARDLTALVQAGLIVAVDGDDDDIRYMVAEHAQDSDRS